MSSKTGLIYLASPYTDDNASVMAERFEGICKAAATIMKAGHHVFSPIAHSHPIAQYGLPKDYAYWKAYCEKTLPLCTEVWVIQLDGHEFSVGVAAEVRLAYALGIPVKRVAPEGLDKFLKGHSI